MNTERLTPWANFAGIVLLIGAITLGVRYVLAPHHFTQGGSGGAGGIPPGTGIRTVQTTFTGYDTRTRKEWTVRPDTVDISSDRSRVEARGNVEARLFDAPSGRLRALVTAPLAVFSRNAKTLQVSGKIVCRVPGDGGVRDLSVDAETLIWNVGAKQVFCPGEVHFVLPTGTGKVRGRDLTLDLVSRGWTLSKFHGEFTVHAGSGGAPPTLPISLKIPAR